MILVPRRVHSRGVSPWKSPFEDFFDPDFFRPETNRMVSFPKVNVHETEKEIIVIADVPGIDPQDINIDVTEEQITVSGKIEEEKEEKEKRCLYQERFYGEFSRSFSLPTRVDASKVRASFKHGTLSITLPKLSSSNMKKVKVEIEK